MVPTNGVSAPTIPMPGMGGASNGNTPTVAPIAGASANPISTVQNNPYAPVVNGAPVAAPPPGTVQQAPFGTDTNTGPGGSYTVQGDFDQTYGQGTGNAITSVLSNLGTTNDAAIQAYLNNMNLQSSKQIGNIQATEAASGVTPNSSTAALAAGDFYSTVNAQESSTVASMETQQENTLLDTLINEGSAHGTDESTFQSIMGVLSPITSLLGSGANVASGITSAANPGADTSILDALGALA
jgi:hypothetical protein